MSSLMVRTVTAIGAMAAASWASAFVPPMLEKPLRLEYDVIEGESRGTLLFEFIPYTEEAPETQAVMVLELDDDPVAWVAGVRQEPWTVRVRRDRADFDKRSRFDWAPLPWVMPFDTPLHGAYIRINWADPDRAVRFEGSEEAPDRLWIAADSKVEVDYHRMRRFAEVPVPEAMDIRFEGRRLELKLRETGLPVGDHNGTVRLLEAGSPVYVSHGVDAETSQFEFSGETTLRQALNDHFHEYGEQQEAEAFAAYKRAGIAQEDSGRSPVLWLLGSAVAVVVAGAGFHMARSR